MARAHEAEQVAMEASKREATAKAEAAMAVEQEESLRFALACVRQALVVGDVPMARANIERALREHSAHET